MRLPRDIYAIQHNVTKRIYIGSSRDVKGRYMNHMYRLRANKHSVEAMQDDFNNYGENYSLYILDKITDFSDKGKEYEWMSKYKTYDREYGYNYKEVGAQAKRKLIDIIPLKDGLPEMKDSKKEAL